MDYPFHPLANEYPPTTPEDVAAIEADMRKNGFDPRFPVVLLDNQILDGRTRYTIATRLGIEWASTDFNEVPNCGTPEEFVWRANENRRELALAWKEQRRRERIARVAEKRREGKSIRVIAEEENVSKTQVVEDIKAATVQGVYSCPAEGKVKGKDGKERPAKKPSQPKPTTKPKPAEPAPPPDPEEAEEAATPPGKDAVGLDVPEHLADQFAANVKFAELLKCIARAAKITSELAQLPGGQFLRKVTQPTASGKAMHFRLASLQEARRTVRFARPHTQCPYCFHEHPESVAPDCRACLGTGVVAELTWKNAPEDYRAGVLLAGVKGADE